MFRDFLCQISKKLGTQCPPKIYFETVIYDNIPLISPCKVIDIDDASSICLDVIEQYGNQAELHLPDAGFKCYKYDEVVNDGNLAYVDTLVYVPERFDCDDFAAVLFGKWAGLAWTNVHALNWFIDENGKFWFIEPQTKKIADKLDDWQGKELRFLLGR